MTIFEHLGRKTAAAHRMTLGKVRTNKDKKKISEALHAKPGNQQYPYAYGVKRQAPVPAPERDPQSTSR